VTLLHKSMIGNWIMVEDCWSEGTPIGRWGREVVSGGPQKERVPHAGTKQRRQRTGLQRVVVAAKSHTRQQ